jgi:hypothetical protein
MEQDRENPNSDHNDRHRENYRPDLVWRLLSTHRTDFAGGGQSDKLLNGLTLFD